MCIRDRYKVGPKNLVDGLARMLNKEKNGFLYSGETNVLATEQGFRGLLAAKQGEKIGKAYNIYDFSTVSYTHLDVYKRQLYSCA